jgi:hypothetical protein
MAQGGNVAEWNETSLERIGHSPYVGARALRGGDWTDFSSEMLALSGDQLAPSGEFLSVGFRVVSVVPEPNTMVLVGPGSLIILWLISGRRIERSHRHAKNV